MLSFEEDIVKNQAQDQGFGSPQRGVLLTAHNWAYLLRQSQLSLTWSRGPGFPFSNEQPKNHSYYHKRLGQDARSYALS